MPTRPSPALSSSGTYCRPEENVQTCLTAVHEVLTFSAPDTATEALLDMVLLTPAQASALHSLMLYGSLLPQMLDYLLSRITRSAVPSTESSMKVCADLSPVSHVCAAVACHNNTPVLCVGLPGMR